MTDTNHIEQRARELLAAECDRTVEGMHYDAYGVVTLHVALSAIRRALSARASAGEGGESEPPKYHCQNGSGHVCLAASLRPGNVVCPHDECDIDTGVFEMPTATPQPAQAGASGGGEVVELRICEVPHLMLRRDQLYRFTVDPNCEACRDAAAFGTAPASPATVDWEQAVVAACMRVESCLAKDDPATTLSNLEQWWYQLGVETTANGFLVEQANATPQPAAAQGVRAFQPGDRIEWQGMNGTWFPGKIVAVRDRVTTYDAKLDDGCDAKDFAAGRFRMLAAAPQPQEAACQHKRSFGAPWRCAKCGHRYDDDTPPAHGDGEGDDDEATEPTELQIEYARGYGDGIRDAEKIAAARPTPEAQEARDAVQWAHDEFEDKEHVARVRGDIGLANYYGVCKAKMAAALALPAQGEGSNG